MKYRISANRLDLTVELRSEKAQERVTNVSSIGGVTYTSLIDNEG